MPKRQRLSRADFSSIQTQKSRRFYGTYFSLSVAPLTGAVHRKNNGFACVVSKKAVSQAHDRNAIKRRCREYSRILSAYIAHDADRRFSIVFFAKKESRSAPYREIARDIHNLLVSAALLPVGTIAGYNTPQ
jgi:ribonuclease P protein component